MYETKYGFKPEKEKKLILFEDIGLKFVHIFISHYQLTYCTFF